MESKNPDILKDVEKMKTEQINNDQDNLIKEILYGKSECSHMLENIKKRLEWCWYEKQHGEGKFYCYDREIDILEIIINAAEWKE